MSTIRSVHQTFSALISEAKQARRDKEKGQAQAERVGRESQAETRQVLSQALEGAPDPVTWPAGPLGATALEQQQKVVTHRLWMKQQLDQATPEYPEQERQILARLEDAYRREKDDVTEAQVEFTNRRAELPSEWRTRWEKQMVGKPADRDALHALMTPPPSRWNVMAYLGASDDQRTMWRITRAHEHDHGTGSLARMVAHVETLNETRTQKEVHSTALKNEAEALRARLTHYEELKAHWDRQEDVPTQQRQAVLNVLRDQPEPVVREWLEAVAPAQVKPYAFAMAKEVGARRVRQGLDGQIKAIDKIISKLQAPMSKLEKGLRHAPSKSISVDEGRIAKQVRQALASMKPLDASAQAALDNLGRLRVEPDSLSQSRFYQRAQTVPATDNAANWLLMWMLLEGQFNPAVAMIAGVNPALALGLSAVLPSWDQKQWDSANTLTPNVPEVPALDGPAGASSVPDTAIPDIPSGGLDLPAGSLDMSLPNLDVPNVNLDLPSMDLNMPTIDVSVPDINLPQVDFTMPDIQVQMPDIQIDTGSFSSGSDYTSF